MAGTAEVEDEVEVAAARRRLPLYIVLIGTFAVSIFYLPALSVFFANDDWPLIYHYGRVPLTEPWRYFSGDVIWFYRPLQAMVYGVLFNLVGLDPFPYNVVLIGMHLAVCVMVYVALSQITDRPLLAAFAAVFFAAHSAYGEILTWKANYNTLQWAFVTLAACAAFARYLRSNDRRWLWATYGLTVLNFFTKEIAVILPGMLLLIWAVIEFRAEPEGTPRRSLMSSFGRATALVGPAAALCALFLLIHRLTVENIYGIWEATYGWAAPQAAVVQLFEMVNRSFFPFYRDPILGSVPGVETGLLWLDRHVMLALPAALGFAVWRKDRTLLLGIGWVVVALIPCAFLQGYNAGRYYYLALPGAVLYTVRLFDLIWGAAGASVEVGKRATPGWLRPVVVAAGLYWIAANVGVTQKVVAMDLDNSLRARAAFELLQENRERIPRGSVVVLRGAPETYFGGGLGIREMARLALGDHTVEGISDSQALPENWEARVQAAGERGICRIDMRPFPPVIEVLTASRP